jgi:hypothetical protein
MLSTMVLVVAPYDEMIRWLTIGLPIWIAFGLGFGPTVALPYGYLSLIQHYMLKFILTEQQSLPLKLIPFLKCCDSLVFLRRVGGSYIFVHRLLMEHFAAMDV